MIDDLDLMVLDSGPPVATVNGQPLERLPKDLYIPSRALQVLLEPFSGPLDLLLYLIKRENIDILDISLTEITRQYLCYLELMNVLEIELAAEYLVMAALLTEIKSHSLLPKPALSCTDEEDDPRMELIHRLQEYESMKRAADLLDQLPVQGRDLFWAMAQRPSSTVSETEGMRSMVKPEDLWTAVQAVLQRAETRVRYAVTAPKTVSIPERMSQILHRLSSEHSVEFTRLLDVREGRGGLVVTFVALLELWRQCAIELSQDTLFGAIAVKSCEIFR